MGVKGIIAFVLVVVKKIFKPKSGGTKVGMVDTPLRKMLEKK